MAWISRALDDDSGRIRYMRPAGAEDGMSQAVETRKVGRAQLRRPAVSQLSLEEEVFSLRTLAPETLNQLPTLFAESVVASAARVLGETTGEAFIRCIGDNRLKEPLEVYSRLDSFLLGGSEEMKKAIVQAFRNRVHRLYRLTLEVAANGTV